MTDTSSTEAPFTVTPIGMAKTVPLNGPEVPLFAANLGLPAASSLSPLPLLGGPSMRGGARDVAAVMEPLASVDPAVARWVFTPLAIPDRILEVRAAVFNGAPSPCRLHATRNMPGVFAGVRPALAFDYELLAPFTSEDIEVWVRLGVQASGGADFPLPARELSGRQLAFLLALADAYKVTLARSYLQRSADPPEHVVRVSDVLAAQSEVRAVRDRRFALCAVDELLRALVHPGGASDVGLPMLDEAFCRAEFARYASEQMVTAAGQDGFTLGLTLGMFAQTMIGWLTITALHDVQIVTVENGRPRAGEDLLLFVATEGTIWTLATSGLSAAGADAGGVSFALRAMDVMAACNLVRDMVRPVEGIVLPDALYAPAVVAAPVAVAPAAAAPQPVAPTPAPVAAAPAAPAAPGTVADPGRWFKPTHTAPATGMDAWSNPDPTAAPAARLDPYLDVMVTEQSGAWARIVCSNGWSAWVDARLLVGRPQ